MNSNHYRCVVIGGGVVGASVLYHLAKLGWTDLVLIERSELTAGSTWHAAAGFHALNADPNVAALQAYTINLYKELEAETGQSCGLHMPGGVSIAGTPERWEWLQAQWAVYQTLGIDTVHLISPAEVKELAPIMDVDGVHGALFDEIEGHLDASGTTYAYAAAAKQRGAEIVLHNRVLELVQRPGGGWTVVTEQGTVTADNVVNAAGLWAKQVGRMSGVDLPVTPMEHHYLVTEPLPEVQALTKELPMMMDLEGYTYARQEQGGLLLGVYELTPKHWNLDGVPWDYGLELIPEDIDRIAPELAVGFERYPCLDGAGIRRWVNGAFTFTPDGNPLVGPVRGLPGYWVACGVMAGFSQGGGVGLTLAQWMVDGEPAGDVYGMDVARYGAYASGRGYLEATTGQFYKRRFVMTYPNEQLPAGRPLKTSAIHTDLEAAGARWGVSWGLETPLYFAADPGFTETPTLRRSNAFEHVAREVTATREGVGILDTTAFSRYEVRGPGARAWLEQLVASKVPGVGGIRLAPMLSPSGRLLGDLTLTCWADDEFWLMGSYYLREWHMRWFESQLPGAGGDASGAAPAGSVAVRDISDDVAGVSLSGPAARDLLAAVTKDDVSGTALKRMRATTLDVGLVRARAGRLSVTGETGYELNVPAAQLRSLYATLREAGAALAARGVPVADIGYNAVNSLRLEKSYGIWSKEFTWAYTPGMSGLDRFVAFDKPAFVGREAARREKETGPAQRLVTLDVATKDAEAGPFEPVWSGERRVGFVTSGGYGHSVGRSLAMAYLDVDLAVPGTPLEVHVVGVRTPATVVEDSPYDPEGLRQRG
ncbi:MAG: FAD-dependent oxidoreductase [Actinobacteria bacterium]|nr:FAD-dependent oxidoreductase [Actinomycetota bacterium]